MKANSGNCFRYLVFSDDWGRHPSSCQHLFRRIAREQEVLWVNTLMRMPRLTPGDFAKIYAKFIKRPLTAANPPPTESTSVTVLRPWMLPLFNRFGRWLNQHWLRWQINQALAATRRDELVVVTTVPIVADIVDKFQAARVVYYCVDEFAEWPGHNRQHLQQMENQLLASANVVIASSSTLYAAKKPRAKQIHLLPHGVDIAHFQQLHRRPLKLPPPVIGYYGLFDERSDQQLLQFIAESHPDWQILIIGKVECDIGHLALHPNITFYGPVPYSELPGYVANFDICILPYRRDALTEFINPLKFKEYLATGIPTVATALPTLRAYADVIGWAGDYKEFVAAVAYFLHRETPVQKKQRRDRTRQYLQDESWENKTHEFLGYLRPQ